MRSLSRREFLKYGMSGVATIAVGSRLPWLRATEARAATQVIDVTITDAMKEMVTHNQINDARCYFWVYEMSADGTPLPPECPGPTIVATAGDTISFSVTNGLDEPHSLAVPGMFDTGPIAPGDTFVGDFTATAAGAFLYYDNLNEPVNRVMGLHGALIVMPAGPQSGHKWTPYDAPSPAVQQLFDDFGSSPHFPGLAWEDGDSTPWAYDATVVNCPPFRQYVWLTHEASPVLFEEVGSQAPGVEYDPNAFMDAFLHDPFEPTRGGNRIPQYFTVNGQSGMFAHMSPTITPIGRVGEPVVIHILNAGLWTHSMHLHANHFYVTSINGTVPESALWLDTFHIHAMDRVDYTVPFMRPPDVGTAQGIGLPDTPLNSIAGTPVWPPVEEMDQFYPPLGTTGLDINEQPVELGERLSPLCYPMHDHSEASQTAQGGNYNCGLISGMYVTGDRNTPGHMDFPMEPHFVAMYRNIRGVAGTSHAPGDLGTHGP